MATVPVSAADRIALGDRERAAGRHAEAAVEYGRAAELAETAGDHDRQVEAVLALARCQVYNVTPGLLPVRLHAAYVSSTDRAQRIRLAGALARCWAYVGEPRRARPFADEALALVAGTDDPVLLADALDAALTASWGPDTLEQRRDWALRLGDVAAHLDDPDARLQAHLWALTLAWEVLDLPRVLREVKALELLALDSAKARFFAASRRLAAEVLLGRTDALPALRRSALEATRQTAIPDGFGVLHSMTAYTAFFAGDVATCAAEAPTFEAYAIGEGVAVVRAEAAIIWLGAQRLDKVQEMITVFTPAVLDDLAPDADWLLTLQCLLEGALAVEDVLLVEDLVARLAPYEGRAVINAGAVMFHGVTDDTLGRAALLLGDRERAGRLLGAARTTYGRIGAVWWRDRLERVAGRAPTRPPAAPLVVHLHEQPGGLWLVGRAEEQSVLPDLRGLSYLRALVARPDHPVEAISLVGERAGTVVEQPGLELLDDRARQAYRRRLTELVRELEEAADDHDLGRQEELAAEREALLTELGAVTGLGGRSRLAGGSRERARVAVRKAIVAALARIAEADPWLGRHLRDHVRTGAQCRYESDPDRPVHWVVHG